MKAVIVFPPAASATYVPLGVAALKAYMTQKVPEVDFQVEDLNIKTWHWLLKRKPEREALFPFVRNNRGEFFNADMYIQHKSDYWDPCHPEFTKLIEACRLYLEQNRIESELQELFTALTGVVRENGHPDIIGFSVMYPRQLLFSLAFGRFLKECSQDGLRVILGGAALSTINCREILEACSFVELILTGEGEGSLEAFFRDTPPSSIPGAVYREKSRICANEKSYTLSLKNVPPPDFSSLPLELYFNPVPVLPVYFSKGCPWGKCRFCVHNYSFSSYRCKSAAAFVDELELYVNKYGARHFYIVDQYIFEKGMEAIADEILRRDLRIYFHFMGRPTAGYTEEFCRKIYRAGCRWISWGIESGAQSLLDLSGKGTKVPVVREVLKNSSTAGINNIGMMIFGLPGSSDAAFDETVDFLNDVSAYLDALTESAFVLFKETPFARNPKEYNLSILGEEELCRIDGKSIHSFRLDFKEINSDGVLQFPRGAAEAAEWDKKKKWFLTSRYYQKFNAEHYLFHVCHERGDQVL